MAAPALALYTTFLLLTFGLRALVQWRRTGRTGFVGLRPRAGALDLVAGGLLVVALAMMPVGLLTTPVDLGTAAAVAGLVIASAGVGGTVWAQFAMGDSWRIGVDDGERLSLVTGGPFRYVRNPIYSSMFVAAAGLVLAVPNAVTLAALVAGVVAVELQVRTVEEPYLRRTVGDEYVQYASGTGRFLPGVGRVPAAAPGPGRR